MFLTFYYDHADGRDMYSFHRDDIAAVTYEVDKGLIELHHADIGHEATAITGMLWWEFKDGERQSIAVDDYQDIVEILNSTLGITFTQPLEVSRNISQITGQPPCSN